ncbi:MAG: hypothetical protein RLZZ262_2308 [Bacteroidota bacterium]|jgi:hypothetical protein
MSALAIVTISLTMQAQSAQVLFYGYVEEGVYENTDETKRKKKEKTPEKLNNVKISIYSADTLMSEVNARETGFYAVLLSSGSQYKVVFEKDGYFCKTFALDCRNVNYSSNDAALKCLTDVSLYKSVQNSDLQTLCMEPYAKCAFSDGQMQWDMEYTAMAKERFYQMAQPYFMAESK